MVGVVRHSLYLILYFVGRNYRSKIFGRSLVVVLLKSIWDLKVLQKYDSYFNTNKIT